MMDHLRFKSSQTAAAYVADSLDREVQEAFELHLMSCPDCVQEVEGWRAIKAGLGEVFPDSVAQAEPDRPLGPDGMRDAPVTAPVSLSAARAGKRAGTSSISRGGPGARSSVPLRVALMCAAAVVFGVGGGWYMRSAQGPAFDSDVIGFYSLPPLSRGPADCTVVALESSARIIAVRVPGLAPQQQLVAIDSEGHDLGAGDFTVRAQGDGSWLVRLRAGALREQGIRFESRSPDGTVEPRGCIISSAS